MSRRTIFILQVVLSTIGLICGLASVVLYCSGCGGVVADSPDADGSLPDAEAVDLPDGVECTESACAEACVAGGFVDGYCVGSTCFCVADVSDGGHEDRTEEDAGPEDLPGAEHEDAEAEDGGPDEIEDVAEEDVAEEDVAEEDGGVEDAAVEDAAIEDVGVEDAVEETEDAGGRVCLEVPEGGHTDFETGSILPFEENSDCAYGGPSPRGDRTYAHGGDMSLLLLAATGIRSCGVVHRFYPLTGVRMSIWVLIPSGEWWNPCTSYPCSDTELADGPTVLGALFQRDGGITIGARTSFTTWTAGTWNLIERDFTCVGPTGYHTVTRVNGIVGYEATVPEAGVICPPALMATSINVSATRFWVDDYCIEVLD